MTRPSYTIESRVVMFTDVHEFSIVMSILGERQYDFLQTIYERLGEHIIAHRGEILKYLGDGMLCVFPENAAVDAVQCALTLRHVYAELVQAWDISHPTELEIGISAGEVAIGVFGHSSLRIKDMFSDIVCQAAAIGHHLGVAITEPVYGMIKSNFATCALPDRQLKWQPEPLRVWEIVED